MLSDQRLVTWYTTPEQLRAVADYLEAAWQNAETRDRCDQISTETVVLRIGIDGDAMRELETMKKD